MQFTFRDVMELDLGTEKTDRLVYQAGKLAGVAFYKQYFAHHKDFNEFVKNLQQMLKDLGVGILRMEKVDMEQGSLILTVSEDLDCSGLPVLHYEICKYDKGFIAGLLESFSGLFFKAKEADCWCTGDRTCRFTAELVK
jgi:predicted hydrocarbon binding protein